MVEIELDDSVTVAMTRGESKPCRYVLRHEDEEVASYETSADPRTAGGRIGLRNVVCQHVPDREKAAVGERLAEEIDAHAAALADEFGPR